MIEFPWRVGEAVSTRLPSAVGGFAGHLTSSAFA